jgi:hypothetical protein
MTERQPDHGEPTAPVAVPSAQEARRQARPTRSGPDRVTVALLSLTAFLLVLALLGTQLGRAGSSRVHSRALLVRRVYRTTVIERVLPAAFGGAAGGSSVTQSVSGSSTGAPMSPPVTRVS